MARLNSQSTAYVMGHSEHEMNRLIEQNHFHEPQTEQLFREAGLRRGMRILDVGCGAGDVSLLAARLVGPSGEVVGLDRSAEALSLARARVAAERRKNVSFVESSIEDFTAKRPFDAVVGRLVLIHQPDPAATLRSLARWIRPGGVMAFHELDMTTGCLSFPPSSELDRFWNLARESFLRSGLDIHTGFNLRQALIDAGLSEPRVMAISRLEGGEDSFIYEYIAQTLRTMVPLFERVGLATAAELQVDTFAQRFREEVLAQKGTVLAAPMVTAWARKPGPAAVRSRGRRGRPGRGHAR